MAWLYYLEDIMSSAFVKESDEQWLHDIPPTLAALTNYLTRENNGIRVTLRSEFSHSKTGKTVYRMSNGLDYMVDNDNRWSIAD